MNEQITFILEALEGAWSRKKINIDIISTHPRSAHCCSNRCISARTIRLMRWDCSQCNVKSFRSRPIIIIIIFKLFSRVFLAPKLLSMFKTSKCGDETQKVMTQFLHVKFHATHHVQTYKSPLLKNLKENEAYLSAYKCLLTISGTPNGLQHHL